MMEIHLWNSTITGAQLRNAISRLQELNRLPGKPRENVPGPLTSSTHRLKGDREIEIVGNLAFLSATSDNYLEVMAVCVEEEPEGEGVIIRLASNTGDLATVTNGFEGLASTLEGQRLEVSINPLHPQGENSKFTTVKSRAEDIVVLFRQIVILDFFRVLSRLRSRHAPVTNKTAGKPALASQLIGALNHSSIRPSTKTAKAKLRSLKSMAGDLHDSFIRLEAITDLFADKIKACELIENIVTQAYKITTAANLSAAIQNSLLEPSLKAHLPEAIGKLGRYYSAASELVCAARDRSCRI